MCCCLAGCVAQAGQAAGGLWNGQIPALVAAGLRCVTFDRRGRGRSDVPGRGYDLDTTCELTGGPGCRGRQTTVPAEIIPRAGREP